MTTIKARKSKTHPYPVYLDGFLKDKHKWGKVETIEPYGDKIEVRFCTECHAMTYSTEGEDGNPHYDSCRVMTDYPGDDAPCLCTEKRYIKAHGIVHKPSGIYGYKDTPDPEPIDFYDLIEASNIKIAKVIKK